MTIRLSWVNQPYALCVYGCELDKFPFGPMLVELDALIRATTVHYCRDRRPGWGLAPVVGLIGLWVCEYLQVSLVICHVSCPLQAPLDIYDAIGISGESAPCRE